MVEITNENGIEVIVSDPSIEADVVNLNELDIRVAKKEYTIVGDNIYVPKLYDDAPEWMKNLVQIVVDVSLETGNVDLINQLNSVLSEFATQYVPLNQYTQSILDLSNEDTRMNAVIETLNSNYNDGISEANAQIIELRLTKASRTEVVAQVLQTISAELQNGESDLGAVVARLDQAIADESSARAMSFETVMASMESLDGTVSGEASATSNLYAYVGYERDGSSTGTGLLADVQILQKQNDGIIETVTGTYDVMVNPQDPNLAELVLTAEPYASWKAQDVSGVDTRLAHIGDVYIKYGITSNGAREYIASFKFIRTVVDASDTHKSTDADGFTWALIVDQAAQDAYNQALNAYDLADNKRRVFVSTPYAPIDEGDLWVTGTNPQVVKVYKSGNWVLADTQVDAFVNSTYIPAVTSLQNQVDGKVESWFQNSTSDPKTAWTDAATRSKHDGDLWYQLDTKRSYWYSSSTNAWNLIDDEKAIQALTNAAAAQTAANNAQTSANTANSLLADIASDNKLVPSEKAAVKKEWDIIQSEYTKNLAQGNVYGISTSSYTSAYNSLSGYITPLLSSLTTTSDIVGTTFRSMFKAYYDANVDLLNAVANKINAIADGKITSYYIDTFSNLQALSNGWTTAEKTSNVGDLATVWNDSTLDNNGLWRWNGTNWISARDKKLVSLASEVTNLSTELNNGTNTWASADSELENSLRTEISSEGARVESKFAYNSTLVLNGTSYNSGFGIATSLTSGSGLPTGQSEFWIKADKFKLMSADGSKKSSYSPFTVDSVTGEINFNGKVTFSNVTGASSSANMLYNSAPAIGIETKGWHVDYNDTGLTSSGLLATGDPFRPTGYGAFHQYINGTPAIGKVFDIRTDGKIPVIGGQYYEASAYLNTHRCNGQIYIQWNDAAGAAITWSMGSIVLQTNTQGNLTNWRRSTLIAQAPVNATSCYFYIRGISTGEANPYVFVSMCYFGRASEGQSVISNWSEGISAGVSSSEVVSAINSGQTTTIDGGKITTGSITASQINTVGLIAENINASELVGKTITGGTIVGASITGVTIKASYLDLDGELEVLTNFYLCVNGNTAGVPAEAIAEGRYRTYSSSLDIDAIPSTNYTNIYRIPTLSTVREPDKEVYLSGVGSYSATYVGSYNTAGIGHNSKCVKPRPYISYNNEILRLSAPGYYSIQYYNLEVSHTVAIYCLGDLVGTFASFSEKNTWSGGNGEESSLTYGAIVNGVRMNTFSTTVNGILFKLDVIGNVPNMAVTTITATCINKYITKNFTTGDIIKAVVTANPVGNQSYNSSAVFKTTSAMTINNMV